MIKTDLIPLMARRFKALGEPVRLALVAALQDGEQSVSELVQLTGRGQPNVSQHLAGLVSAGLVASRREGSHVFYRIADPLVLQICATICKSVEAARAVAAPPEAPAARASGASRRRTRPKTTPRRSPRAAKAGGVGRG